MADDVAMDGCEGRFLFRGALSAASVSSLGRLLPFAVSVLAAGLAFGRAAAMTALPLSPVIWIV